MDKVYLLFEAKGDYEDYHEYIHSIYLNLDKAEIAKSELEFVADKIRRCDECVCSGFCIPDCDCEGIDNCDELRIKYANEYCDNSDAYINKWTQDGEEYERLECHNKLNAYGDDYTYRIEEKEVIK